MTRLIYLSPVPWASFAQRPQKFVEWFHARTGSDVIWVDPYPTRLPRLSDLRRPRPAKALAGNARPHWLRVLKPLALPIEPLPGSGWINVFWRPTLCALERFALGHDTLVVAGKPSVFALAVLKRLKHARSLYDAMDEFPAFYTGELSSGLSESLDERYVEEAMTEHVFSVTPEERVSVIAVMMRQHRIHRVIVVEDRKVVGILTALDLIQILENH